MKSVLAALLVVFTFTSAAHAVNFEANAVVSAKKGKAKGEPAPGGDRRGGGEQRDPREETYEGGTECGGGHPDNCGDRDTGFGGYLDGDGFGRGDDVGGGMMGELFFAPVFNNGPAQTKSVKTEDRGEYVVITQSESEDIDASLTCTTITETVIEKATQKVISTKTREFCNRWPL